VRAANLTARFVLELCLLAALAYDGLQVDIVLAVCAPALAAIIWGLVVSPKATFAPARPIWVAVQVVLFGAAVAGLAAAGNGVIAALFAVAVAVNLGLVLFWHQADTDTSRLRA
jgi:hypothetical protein